MMSTYTLKDLRLPRPAAAGSAMTLFFTVNYQLLTISFLCARNVMSMENKVVAEASGENMNCEIGNMKCGRYVAITTISYQL